MDQPKDVQGMVLKLINHQVLTEIDVMDEKFETSQLHPSHTKTLQRTYSKSPKQKPTRSDSGFSASDVSATGAVIFQTRDLNRDKTLPWTCLSQYCALMTSPDSSMALEVTKSLKAMATLGSRHLKGELLRLVVLPCILRYGGESALCGQDAFDKPTRNTRARSWTGPFSAEWLEARKTSVKRSAFSTPDDAFLSEQSCVDGSVSREVLQLCVNYLTTLLVFQPSRELFLSCGGINELQSFLVLPELQEPVLCVLELLAGIENEGQLMKAQKADESGELSASSPETSSEEKTERESCCHSLLSLLRWTAHSMQTTTNPNEAVAKTLEMSYLRAESCLRVHVWRTCLQILVSNQLFCDLFVEDNGMFYSYDLLRALFEFFETCSAGDVAGNTSLDDSAYGKDLVGLFESVLPVCIRMAHTDQWQDTVVRNLLLCFESFSHCIDYLVFLFYLFCLAS